MNTRIVICQMKKVANQTKGGKKRTVSALVVVGNGNGMAGQYRLCQAYITVPPSPPTITSHPHLLPCAGFAVGRGEELRAAIRKVYTRSYDERCCISTCNLSSPGKEQGSQLSAVYPAMRQTYQSALMLSPSSYMLVSISVFIFTSICCSLPQC